MLDSSVLIARSPNSLPFGRHINEYSLKYGPISNIVRNCRFYCKWIIMCSLFQTRKLFTFFIISLAGVIFNLRSKALEFAKMKMFSGMLSNKLLYIFICQSNSDTTHKHLTFILLRKYE